MVAIVSKNNSMNVVVIDDNNYNSNNNMMDSSSMLEETKKERRRSGSKKESKDEKKEKKKMKKEEEKKRKEEEKRRKRKEEKKAEKKKLEKARKEAKKMAQKESSWSCSRYNESTSILDSLNMKLEILSRGISDSTESTAAMSTDHDESFVFNTSIEDSSCHLDISSKELELDRKGIEDIRAWCLKDDDNDSYAKETLLLNRQLKYLQNQMNEKKKRTNQRLQELNERKQKAREERRKYTNLVFEQQEESNALKAQVNIMKKIVSNSEKKVKIIKTNEYDIIKKYYHQFERKIHKYGIKNEHMLQCQRTISDKLTTMSTTTLPGLCEKKFTLEDELELLKETKKDLTAIGNETVQQYKLISFKRTEFQKCIMHVISIIKEHYSEDSKMYIDAHNVAYQCNMKSKQIWEKVDQEFGDICS